LKVGGGTDPAKRRKNIFFGRAPPLFGSKSTISRFDERFRDGQYSLVSFLFAVLLLTVPTYPAICKSGGTCPPRPMESAPLFVLPADRW